MANGDSNNGGSDERNPFVAFRHFADEHITAALGLLTDVNADMWKRLEDAEGDARKAWKKFNDSYERSTSPERRQTEREGAEKPSSTSCPINAGRQHEEWAPHREERDLPWSGWGAEHWPAMRFGFDRFFDRPGPWRPSLEFLARNRYSPLVLEQRYPTEQQGAKWRSAFEDLLKTDIGETPSEVGSKDLIDKREQPEDWLRRMISKDLVTIRREPWFWVDERHPGAWGRGFTNGFHGPTWNASRRAVEEGERKVKQANTELDLYEHFLGDRSSTPAHQIQEMPETELKPQITVNDKPSVVATMTTTEQRMLPDGTVTTKTVLKKKFSDGTEDTQETNNTIPGNAYREQMVAVLLPEAKEKLQVKEEVEVKDPAEAKLIPETKQVEKPKGKSSNWFWS